jgi:hypothetical protein
MNQFEPIDPEDERTAVVAGAMNRLEPDEQEILVQIYYLGKSYQEISRRSGRQTYRLKSLHHRAVCKLRRCLREYVKRRYGIVVQPPACPICESPHCAEINALILNRDRTDTWRPVLQIIREEYGLDIRSPQRLMGHERNHIISPDPPGEIGGTE